MAWHYLHSVQIQPARQTHGGSKSDNESENVRYLLCPFPVLPLRFSVSPLVLFCPSFATSIAYSCFPVFLVSCIIIIITTIITLTLATRPPMLIYPLSTWPVIGNHRAFSTVARTLTFQNRTRIRIRIEPEPLLKVQYHVPLSPCPLVLATSYATTPRRLRILRTLTAPSIMQISVPCPSVLLFYLPRSIHTFIPNSNSPNSLKIHPLPPCVT